MQSTEIKPREIQWGPVGRVAILQSRYYPEITGALAEGARRVFEEAGTPAEQIEILPVAGSFELSQAASTVARTGRYACIVALGCLIRGETAHFDYIARTVVAGLDRVGRETGVPVSLGILTVDTMRQAQARAGGKHGNKGEEAADAALELARLFRTLRDHVQPTKSA